jgi:chromosome segregation ATPase
MNTAQAQALGERIARLETLIETMAERQKSRDDHIKHLAEEITRLNELLAQAKGAKWALVGLIGLAGTAGGFIGKYAAVLPIPR